VEPVRSYVICCVQRTGSWLLAHTLADTGYAGRPSDYFDGAERENHTREWGVPPGHLAPYVRAMWGHATAPNGVLGSKLMWNDFDWLRSSLRPPAGIAVSGSRRRSGAPGQVAAQVRLGVLMGRAGEAGQVDGHCQAQLVSEGHWMIGWDGCQVCEGAHARTSRPPPAVTKPATCQARHTRTFGP
jgi:hypothetical protein